MGQLDRTEGGSEHGGWPPSHAQIEAARSGDDDALGTILSLGYPKIVSFYRGMGLRWADAEEVASEALEGMVRNLPKLREAAAFEGWFWTVARNRMRSRFRKSSRVERELEYGLVDDPADLAAATDEHAAIRAALDQLPERDRQILWLREVEGLTHEEIASRLAMATGATRVAALRARRRLEEIYAKLHPE
ncbi:MAG: sigma-70 family RNA polymerase sigma factor [Acidimicrobiia bacterium]|nr:sigma-70 family RNA polymerase sigma factor [Acidimicrobiia bacterium]